jgi:regulator of PEP synthase PpsR (kinase-PPPase family)
MRVGLQGMQEKRAQFASQPDPGAFGEVAIQCYHSDMITNRSVFFISDGTGITAETKGHSLLAHFPDYHFHMVRMPFIDTEEKARNALERIIATQIQEKVRPILVMTLVNAELRKIFENCGALCLDLFGTFISPLGLELGQEPAQAVGMARGTSSQDYRERVHAINFTLLHDDGLSENTLKEADLILVGVSRSGKTPTSLYLAMQFGIKTANCPLIPEDLERMQLPEGLTQHKSKLFGLTIAPERLQHIRQERRPNSQYASLENCKLEVKQAEQLMEKNGVRWLDSTTRSIEEMATAILQEAGLNKD